MDKAGYRKIYDRSLNSSTYHKKDSVNVRAALKRDTKGLVNSEQNINSSTVKHGNQHALT